MTKFKVGDLLRVKDDAGPEHWRGQNGLCIETNIKNAIDLNYDYRLLINDTDRICFYEDELEMLSEGNRNE